MKLPGSGGCSHRDLVWEGWAAPVAFTDSPLVERLKAANPRGGICSVDSSGSLAQLQLFGDSHVALGAGGVKIIKEPAALADHHQQPAARAVILVVFLQMLGQRVNATGQK